MIFISHYGINNISKINNVCRDKKWLKEYIWENKLGRLLMVKEYFIIVKTLLT